MITIEADWLSAFFRLAVQWHPEVGTDPRLFRAFVEAAASRR